MAKGEYYLGVKNDNGGYSNIDLSTINVDGKEVTKKLLSIINFTTRYASIEDLLNDLKRFGLVAKEANGEDLAYVAEHGNKKSGYTYRPIRYGKNIYLNKYENCFKENKLKSFVIDNMQDVKFAKNLYMEVCVKRGVLADFMDYIRLSFETNAIDNSNISKDGYISVCNSIKNRYNNSDSFKSLINSFINEAREGKFPQNSAELESKINEIYHHVKKDGYVLFQHVNNKANYYLKNSHVSYASAGYNMAKQLRKIREDRTNDDSVILTDIKQNAEKLYESLVKKRSSVEFEISDRTFVDLAWFVAHYEHYIKGLGYDVTIAKKESEKLDTKAIVKHESIIPDEEDLKDYEAFLNGTIVQSNEEELERGPVKVLSQN